MGFVGKNPTFTSTSFVDQGSALSNPASGFYTLYLLNGGLTTRDSSGTEVTYGAASAATPTTAGTVTSYTPIIQSSVKSVASTTYTILDSDGFDKILVTTGASDRTITLPTAAANTGRVIKFIKVDTGAGDIVVDGEGAETINGLTTRNLIGQYAELEVVCDGSGWFITHDRMNWQDAGTVAGDFNGCGTPSSIDVEYILKGVNLYMRGQFSTGTCTSAEFRLNLPNSYTINQSPTQPLPEGRLFGANGTANRYAFLLTHGDTYVNLTYTANAAAAALTPQPGNALASSTTFAFTVGPIPISELT